MSYVQFDGPHDSYRFFAAKDAPAQGVVPLVGDADASRLLFSKLKVRDRTALQQLTQLHAPEKAGQRDQALAQLTVDAICAGKLMVVKHQPQTSHVSDETPLLLAAVKTKAKTNTEKSPSNNPTTSGKADAPSKSFNVAKDVPQESQHPASEHCHFAGDPVNLFTGEEMLDQTDFALPGAIPLQVRRVYRSLHAQRKGIFGYGWCSDNDQYLVEHAEHFSWFDAEGRTIVFDHPGLNGRSWHPRESVTLVCTSEQRVEIHDAQQRCWTYQRTDKHYRLAYVYDAGGNKNTYHYDNNGRLVQVRHSAGLAYELRYSAKGFVTQINLGRLDDHRRFVPIKQQSYGYQYNEFGDLVSTHDTLGCGETFDYDHHYLVQRQLKSGFRFRFQWADIGGRRRVVSHSGDQGNYDYQFEYQPEQYQSVSIDSRGARTQYQFDDRGLLLTLTDPKGATTHYTYNHHGQKTSQTDALGRKTQWVYDQKGRLASVVLPDCTTQHYQYNGLNQPIQMLDADNQAWSRAYDFAGQIRSQTDPLGNTTHYHYNRRGQLSKRIDALGQTVEYLWAKDGSLAAIKDAGGGMTEFAYDELGRLIRCLSPEGGLTEYHYDSRGLIVRVEEAKHWQQPEQTGRVHQFSYDRAQRLISHTDALGQVTRYEYGGLAQITARVNPDGSRLEYHYDSERNLIGLTNEKGERYRLAYDDNENLIQEIGFDGRIQRYHYDAINQLIKSEDGKDSVSRYQRDAFGRLTERTTVKKPTQQQTYTAFAYDTHGRLLHANNAHRRLRFEYDAAGRLTQEWQDDYRIERRYDALGRLVATQLPGGNKITHDVDAHGQVVRVGWNGQTLMSSQYNGDGAEMHRVFGNGLAGEYQYDEAGRLARHRLIQQKNKHPVVQRDYGYDALGRLTAIQDSIRGSKQYHYDPKGQIRYVTGYLEEVFAFDPAGNLLDDSNPEVNGNRLSHFQDEHYRYDDAGNLIERIKGQGGKYQTRFEYNGENQMIAVHVNGEQYDYHYDALGRRIAKADRFGTTVFYWNGDVLLEEQRGGQSTQYVFEPDGFKPLASIQQGDIYYYHLDHLGTPQELSDANGKLQWQGRYKTYGALALKDEPNNLAQPFRFQGQYFDAETGLHYNRHRYYNPVAGRFINQDPVGLLGGMNNYQYAPNPVGWIDPFGLTCKEGMGVPKGIKTPWGVADQVTDAASMAARSQVQEGATLYRIGTTGKSQAAEAQFWSLENPLSAGYAQRYGIPASNVKNANFIEIATLKPSTPFVTRPAPAVGSNKGGGIEVVVPENGVKMHAFNYGGID